jgi:hypothetical protein
LVARKIVDAISRREQVDCVTLVERGAREFDCRVRVLVRIRRRREKKCQRFHRRSLIPPLEVNLIIGVRLLDSARAKNLDLSHVT